MKYLFLLCLITSLCGCGRHSQEVQPEGRTAAGGNQYTIFHPQNLGIRITTSRPDVADNRIRLCVVAAYTDLDTNQPLGLLVSNGRELQATASVGFLNGVLTMVGDSLMISQLPMGQLPPATAVARAKQQRGTLLLQELLVYQGRSVHTAGGSVFQRRALAEMADHRFAVVESASDNLTLKQFGDDLLALGARNALYLDMGDWDEGWYKAGSRVVKLGHRRTETARQSNWLVFARRN